jgi:hypothetical protein
MATLGGFSRTIELSFTGYELAISNLWWVSDAAGSYRAAVNAAVSNLAWASGKGASLFEPWPYVATNFVRNTNCWVADIDLTCASPWNSYRYPYTLNGTNYLHNPGGYYHAGTLVTPQHFIYAVHWATPTGTVFKWIDRTNGVHDRTLVDQRFLDNDVAVGLLDSPLPEQIKPATVLDSVQNGVLRGKFNLRGCPGYRIVYLDAQERAWMAWANFAEKTDLFGWPENTGIAGSEADPFSRARSRWRRFGKPRFPHGRNQRHAADHVPFCQFRADAGQLQKRHRSGHRRNGQLILCVHR